MSRRPHPWSPRLLRYPAGEWRPWLRGDLLAGLTVAAYLIPQVMAYATLAGLPPVAGLWAALAPLAGYALLGSSRLLSVGPESTTALMTATVIAPLAGGDPGRYAVLAATLAAVVGVMSLVAFAARLGFVADLLSRPILVGYMAGVALIMIVGQLARITGVPVAGHSFPGHVASFVAHLGQAHPPTLVFAAAILALLLLLPRWLPGVPSPLLAVALATVAVALLDLSRYGIGVVGPIPGGLPPVTLPNMADVPVLAVPALGVLLVGYTDTVLTARSFAARDGHPVDPNRELLAQGAANLGSGALSGFPVSSSGSRTALAESAGARTQVYSLVVLGGVLAALLFAGPLLARCPTAALGALVVYAALRLIDVRSFRRLAAFRRSELLLALAAMAGVLVFDILYGILLAIGLSVAEMLYRVARPHDAIQGLVPDLPGMHDIDDYPQATTIPGLVVYRYDSPLFFANAQDFRRRALAAATGSPEHSGRSTGPPEPPAALATDPAQPVAWFVLNAEANVEVDITALDALEDLRSVLSARGVTFAMARVKQDLRAELDAYGLTEAIGADRIFPTLPTAVAAYRAWCRDRAPGTS